MLQKRCATIVSSFEPFRLYWSLYGGLTGLLLSPYLWCAVLLAWLCSPLWLTVERDGTRAGIVLALAIVPALMAFTLAGMAIVLALSGKRFIDAIREDGAEKSLFMKVVALFFHFLLVQTLALAASLLSRTYGASNVLAGTAFFLTTYGITSAVAIAAMLLNVSRIFNVTGGGDE